MALSLQRQGDSTSNSLPPELQQEILSYFDEDVAALSIAIRVSKAWYHDCIGMLWCISSQKMLTKVSTPDRQQYYANLIVDLNVDDELSHNWCDGLEFPSLKMIRFMRGSLPVSKFRHLLQTGLHTLHYSNREPDDATLQMLGSCPNQVEELEMMLPESSNISPDQFMPFLQSFPALRRLNLTFIPADIMDRVYAWKGDAVAQLEELSMIERGWDPARDLGLRNSFLKRCTGLRMLYLDRGDTISADALAQLSSLASLENLSIEAWISDYVGKQLEEKLSDDKNSVCRPFSHIKTMYLCGGKPAIMPFVSSTITTLVNLNLEVDDHLDSICPAISRLSNLVHLRIVFSIYKQLTRTDLDLITELSRLQTCQIDRQERDEILQGTGSSSLDCSWITDLYFKSWIAKLRRLRSLRLRFDNPTLTQVSLQYIAESCPLLTNCDLIWEHDLNTWTSLEAPLFPNLLVLRLKGVKDHGYGQDRAMIDEHALRDIEMIRDLAPDLESFYIESNLEHEKALTTVFRSGS